MDKKYIVKINCIVFGTDIANNKKYILSLDTKDLIFPFLNINDQDILNINNSLIKYLRQYIFVNEMELLPQLITLHSQNIESTNDTINVVYGFVINHTININNAYWHDFDLLDQTKYSNIIFETIQKLR